MTDFPLTSRRIKILRDDVSRKIAAGEVIDRPFSIVRELLDNAIDAGASSVDVYIEEGGISRVRVVDDGAGMDRKDLELCWQPHATSKIETADDLLTVTSLGFRGEALSSIAVAARMEIVSGAAEGSGGAPAAARVSVRGGKLLGIEACQGRKGTSVDVSELFFDYPARRKFLKGVSAESALCKSAFVDKALAHPAIAFKLFVDGSLKLFLPPASLPERVAAALGQGLDARALEEGSAEAAGVSVKAVAADPDVRRRDRRLIQIFVNRRRVPEFSLIQAVEFGYAGFMPGGWYPAAFVFVEIDPSLADFNIHPAKKEVRFRSPQEVHSVVVRAVRAALAGRTPAQRAPQAPLRIPDFMQGINPPQRRDGERFHHDIVPDLNQPVEPGPALLPAPARFLGQVFNVFLLFEMEDRLLFLDQHAAHEKLIFEKLQSRKPALQALLIPLSFDVSEDEGRKASARLDEFAAAGIVMRPLSAASFEILSLGADFALLSETDLVEMILESLDAGEEWRRGLRARAACRLAIKEGDPVDPVTAAELLRKALLLENPRCPHGRPIWHVISKAELYSLVDRTP